MTRWIALILLTFIVLDIFVWRRLHTCFSSPCAIADDGAWFLSLLMAPTLAFAATCIVANPIVGSTENPAPHWLMSALFIWHFLILPPVLIALLIELIIRYVRWTIRRFSPPALQPPVPTPSPSHSSNPSYPSHPLFSRRHFLAASAITVPPVVTLCLSSLAVAQLGKFRIRSYHLSPAGWPRDLDGFAIALVADVHTGAFSTPTMLKNIASATNNLRADLILLGGDLVNISHADLPSALDMVMRMDAPRGLYMIQGNHDVIQGPGEFDAACRRRGVSLLVDEMATITARGAAFQLLGTRWASPQSRMNESVARTAALRDPGLFPIMLAHHPHSWDPAAAAGIPLVLSGHTHGGQIMLTDQIGGGPLRFKYWSGQYDRPGSTLIVSNGVGNWFPLRINAPAEINCITLHPKVE